VALADCASAACNSTALNQTGFRKLNDAKRC
jgi:hypothetical protein